MKNLFVTIALSSALLVSCVPDNFKEKMAEGLKESSRMMADMNFKHAINSIELHKLRTGIYPDSLTQIEFISAFDISALASVEYHKLDSGYELNNIARYQGMNGKQGDTIALEYPDNFWTGLGCVKSNVKK